MDDDAPEPGMEKDEIVLPDGRYLIFYTFENGDGDGDGPSADCQNV